jgi:filamentous hemagglutinin family protein
MGLRKKWQRYFRLQEAKTARRSQSLGQSVINRIAAGIAGLGFLATSNFAFGSTITPHNPNTTITQTGNVYKIETTTKSGVNAFNSFEAFNLSSGHTANFYLPASTNNLLNFVKTQINIDGTVNAIKNSKIGGNLYFLSSQGLVVGSTGVINCGAFYAMTPTADFMEKFVKTGALNLAGNDNEISHIVNRHFVNHDGIKSGDGVPLNADGSIVINGRINATDNIGAWSRTVTTGNTASLNTGITNFTGMVSTADIRGSHHPNDYDFRPGWQR